MMIHIGYRRLYRGVGSDLGKYSILKVEVPISDITIQIFLSREPTLEWYERHGETQFFSGQKVALSVKISPEDVGSATPNTIYSDIYAWKGADVSDELYTGLLVDNEAAKNEALRMAREDTDLLLASDIACGTIGLHLHNQFVTDLVFDACYVECDTHLVANSYQFIAPQMLMALHVTEEAFKGFDEAISTAARPDQISVRRKALAFNWLLRGWAENDRISKFLAFFTAIEIVLGGYQGTRQAVDQSVLDDIRSLITAHGGEKAQSMHTALNHLRLPSPSLSTRFETMAKTAAMESCEDDIRAFGSFNRWRNGLVHQGDQSVSLKLSIGETEIADIEQIAMRYVNWAVFRDAAMQNHVVYASRLPRIESGIQIKVQRMVPSA